MASSSISSDVFEKFPIYVFSSIPGLVQYLEKLNFKVIPIGTRITVSQRDCIRAAEILICDTPFLPKLSVLMPNLKWAHCTTAGVESLFKAMPRKPPFLITRHAGDSFCRLMAEFVVGQIISRERSFREIMEIHRSQRWATRSDLRDYRSLDQLTVAILGVGNMGCAIAKYLRAGGSTVFGFARTPHSGDRASKIFDQIYLTLEEALPDCDYICNTLPDTPQTKGMLENDRLNVCLKQPVFIDVGHANVLDGDAVITAIRKEYLSGAILDVVEKEPLPKNDFLWYLPQITVTPHVAAVSLPHHIAEDFQHNFMCFARQCQLPNTVNWAAGY